ncbi:hypothetical protein WJX81_002186 [Elliptochloris bilobata]|uniref:Alpha-1,3/1,6-mannosyltransferase ALG2 n=1 Tax=Elliptochloris bilobata TaxID=381761 RepID=A0AAW1RDL0_9CHLO
MVRERPLAVAFIHPDLGLGGAERLVVDAALELSARGHAVDMFTAHHDRRRCFEETLDGPFSVTVCGSWFPRSVCSRFTALCAYVRCILIAIYVAWGAWRRRRQYDVIFVDQVSAVIPVLHLLTRSKVLFYCHFPDLLLVQRRSRLRSLYRAPLNRIEEVSTGCADRLLVNSNFTNETFVRTFRRLVKRDVLPGVLHPAVRVPSQTDLERVAERWREHFPADLAHFLEGGPVFLSVNRFERKKGLDLAVRALGVLLTQQVDAHREVASCRLAVAGGYDERLQENREVLAELKVLVATLGLTDRVRFLPSFSEHHREGLFHTARAVVYTPQNEHFGIVPLEAMAAARPVIACNSGGPRESVLHGATGFLCRPDPVAVAAAMAQLTVKAAAERMGRAARSHVLRNFTRGAFGQRLEKIVHEMVDGMSEI